MLTVQKACEKCNAGYTSRKASEQRCPYPAVSCSTEAAMSDPWEQLPKDIKLHLSQEGVKDGNALSKYMKYTPVGADPVSRVKEAFGLNVSQATTVVELFYEAGQKEFEVFDVGNDLKPSTITHCTFSLEHEFEGWLSRGSWRSLVHVNGKDEIIKLADIQSFETYRPAGIGQIETIQGQLANIAVGMERKGGEKAVKVLEAEGHQGIKLSPQKQWVAKKAGGESREVDAVAVADRCVIAVEATGIATSTKAEQLVAALKFMKTHQDEPSFKDMRGKKLRGALYSRTITKNQTDQQELLRVLKKGFDGEPISLWQENGTDISDGSNSICSPTQGTRVCAKHVKKPSVRIALKPRPFMQRIGL